MVLFVSSAIGWVENDMVFGYGRIGKIYESANQVKRVYFR